MGKAKNIVLETITYIAFMMAIISGYLTEVGHTTKMIILIASLAWFCLFKCVNGKVVL